MIKLMKMDPAKQLLFVPEFDWKARQRQKISILSEFIVKVNSILNIFVIMIANTIGKLILLLIFMQMIDQK